jgi:formylglycine-generating enzyme required for sulfatase activity
LIFCNKLSELHGFEPCFSLTDIDKFGPHHIISAVVEWNRDANGYRLPTEAEWEYAAKAGTELIFSGSNEVDEVAYHVDNSEQKTYKVKTKKSNNWGLYDMSGNVWEWCMDEWQENMYKNENREKENPVLWRNYADFRTIRGGSIGYSPEDCRCIFRAPNPTDTLSDDIGFRLVRYLPKS